MQPLPNPSPRSIAPRNRVIYLEPAADPSKTSGSDLAAQFVPFRRSKLLLAVFAIAGGLAGLAAILGQPELYAARTSIEIVPVSSNPLDTEEFDPAIEDYRSPAYLMTQIRILGGKALEQRVLTKLEPALRTDFVLPHSRLDAIKSTVGWQKDPLPEQREKAAGATLASLEIQTPPNSRIIALSAQSSDPKFAADYLRTLVSEYVDQTFELRDASTQRAEAWLETQVAELRKSLLESQNRLQQYAQMNDLVISTDDNTVAVNRLRYLEEELSRAQAERVAAQSEFTVARQSPIESIPLVLNNERLNGYKQQVTELRRQLAELNTRLTPEHPSVQRVQAQITELESALETEPQRILLGIGNRYEAAMKREAMLATAYQEQLKTVSSQTGSGIAYDILRHEVDINRQLYESMLQKVKESSVAWTLRANRVRVLEPAETNPSPEGPNMALAGAEGALAGLVLGIGLVFLRNRMDTNIHGPGDTQTHLGLPELGVIPAFDRDPARNGRSADRLLPLPRSGNANSRDGDVAMATWNRKPSMLAESFRSTLTSLLCHDRRGVSPRLILVTSPGAREGKTVVASNLSIALAESGRRVVLIDADMRRPRLHRVFNIVNSWGLSDLLTNKSSIEDWPIESLIKKTEVPGLHLLPSGPALEHVSGLLYSERMVELLRRFRMEFDSVLIDTPPLLSVSDARVLSRLTDGAVLVVRSGQTARAAAAMAARRLADDGTPVLGTVLNDWDLSESRYYSGNYFANTANGDGA